MIDGVIPTRLHSPSLKNTQTHVNQLFMYSYSIKSEIIAYLIHYSKQIKVNLIMFCTHVVCMCVFEKKNILYSEHVSEDLPLLYLLKNIQGCMINVKYTIYSAHRVSTIAIVPTPPASPSAMHSSISAISSRAAPDRVLPKNITIGSKSLCI